MITDSHSEADSICGMMKTDFLNLEFKYQSWFDEKDSFIEEYFVDRDLKKDLLSDCELPEYIQVEVAIIQSKFRIELSKLNLSKSRYI
jgi:hypothetical protein